MYCFVDFRNRPQYKYTFSSLEKAREYIRKIQNNSLGVTAMFSDGRREYFENGLPDNFLKSGKKIAKIKKGWHVKYKIRPFSTLDGALAKKAKQSNENISGWRKKTASSLFMLGNLKFSACLLVVSVFVFSLTYIFQKNLGQSAVAKNVPKYRGIVLGAEDNKMDIKPEEFASDNTASIELADEDVIMNLIAKVDDERHEDFRQEIMQYIKGKPMEDMAPHIAKQPRMVAAFIVGIAMKESKFGVYAPHDANGRDCHNYWGYRGPENTTASGYSCFSSPEHAIQVVGKKINKLVAQGISNPAEMISWKCGSTCAGHGAENVRKWISDVGINFYKLNSKQNS